MRFRSLAMTTEQSPVEAIFFAALEKGAPAERVAYLDAACGNDDNLRQRVDRLLAAHPQVGSFLEPPARDEVGAAEAPTIPPHEKSPAGLGQTETAPYESPVEDVGAVIAGKYKLLETLGQGGMGAVFMAQQTQPVKRLVALKLIKLGMDSKQVLARFGAERQALALMDHPNIAKVLDAGTTDSGRPFFVMELVKGVPITGFCDERQLSPRQRLELFIPVCQAIQHAHQKGIIHRDIKPSNVLVALYDDRPVPKVIDFGVAKATGQQLTDASLMTGFGGVVGTPEYMSPEQAQLNQLDIDTRSDVYALGVLLYELLTGTTPIDRKRLGQGALFEVLRIIREEEPPRPSTRLSTSDALASIAATRRTEPARLAKLMRGELDWIVMKALEKDRTRRYESASGLASDVERYLHDEPVEAGPPSARYRLRKLARRYRRGLLVAGAFALLLVAGAAVSAWEAYQARRAEQAAVQDRDRAVSAEQTASREQQRALAAEAIAVAAKEQTQDALAGAVAAKEQTQDTLAASLYDQARAVRLSGMPGRRWRALELLKESEHLLSRKRPLLSKLPAGKEQLAVQHEVLSRSQLRSEAVAAVLLDDARVSREWGGLSHSVSPDGTLAASIWLDLEHWSAGLAITDLKTGKQISKWEGQDGRPLIGSAIALGPNGKRLASVSPAPPYRINVWQLPERKLLRELSLPKRAEKPTSKTRNAEAGASAIRLLADLLGAIEFSPNGRYLCGVTVANRLVVWDLEGDPVGHEVGGGIENGLLGANFSPDSRVLALASSGRKVVLWELAGNRLDKEIELPLEVIGPAGFAPDGTLGILCAQSNEKPGSQGGAKTLLIWDVAHNHEMKRIGALSGTLSGIAFSPDGARVAVGSSRVSGDILVLDVAGRKSAVTLHHQGFVQLLAWTDDGRHLVSGDRRTLAIWDLPDESPVSDLRLGGEPDTGFQGPFAFSPDRRFVAVKSRGKPHLDLYDVAARKLVRRVPYEASDKSEPIALLFSPQGKDLVCLGNHDVVVWGVETGKQRSRMDANPTQQRTFDSIGIRANGNVIVGGTDDLKPAVFEVDSGRMIWQAQQKMEATVTVSPDGRFATTLPLTRAHALALEMVVFGRTGTQPVSIVDLFTGQERYQLPGVPKTLVQVMREFSPDSRWLLSLHVRRAVALGPAFTRSGGENLGVPLSGAGKSEQPWTADVWEIPTGKRQMQIEGSGNVLRAGSNPITCTFSRDGRYLAIAATGAAVRFYDVEGGQELFDWYPFGNHPEGSFYPDQLAFTADSTSVVIPDRASPTFHILNLPRLNEQLRTAALNW
jgi:serine/threonine protein kinase/WD40 repeat protein